MLSLALVGLGLYFPAATNANLFDIGKTIVSLDPNAIDFYRPIAIAFAVIAAISLLFSFFGRLKGTIVWSLFGVIVWSLSVAGFQLWQTSEIERLNQLSVNPNLMASLNSAVVKNLHLQYGAYLILAGFCFSLLLALNQARCARRG